MRADGPTTPTGRITAPIPESHASFLFKFMGAKEEKAPIQEESIPVGGSKVAMNKIDEGEGKISMGKGGADSLTGPIGQHDEHMSGIFDSAVEDSDEDKHIQERAAPERGAATFLDATNDVRKRNLTSRLTNG